MNNYSPIKNSVTPEDKFRFIYEIIDSQPWINDFEEELTHLFKFCDSYDEQMLLSHLLKEFFYLTDIKEREACLALNGKIHEWKLSSTNTWIVAVANNHEVDGSSAGLQKLKNKIKPIEDWHNRFISNIPTAIDSIKEDENVLLFDDFIGTGEKMLKKVNWIRKLLTQKGLDANKIKIYTAGFAGMRFGLENFSKQSDCEIYAKHILLKGISDKFPSSQVNSYIEIMLSLENKLGEKYKKKKLSDYSLGFMRSETLYCGANDNCPNNVFPILWWPIIKDGTRHRTILTRAG